jgi:hypothetical protein
MSHPHHRLPNLPLPAALLIAAAGPARALTPADQLAGY